MTEEKRRNNSQAAQAIGGIITLLLIIFSSLKIAGVVDWSWWTVTLPITIPVGLALFLGLIALGASD